MQQREYALISEKTFQEGRCKRTCRKTTQEARGMDWVWLRDNCITLDRNVFLIHRPGLTGSEQIQNTGLPTISEHAVWGWAKFRVSHAFTNQS